MGPAAAAEVPFPAGCAGQSGAESGYWCLSSSIGPAGTALFMLSVRRCPMWRWVRDKRHRRDAASTPIASVSQGSAATIMDVPSDISDRRAAQMIGDSRDLVCKLLDTRQRFVPSLLIIRLRQRIASKVEGRGNASYTVDKSGGGVSARNCVISVYSTITFPKLKLKLKKSRK